MDENNEFEFQENFKLAMPIDMDVLEFVKGDTHFGGTLTRIARHDNNTVTLSLSTMDGNGHPSQNANVTLSRAQTKMLKMLLEDDY